MTVLNPSEHYPLWVDKSRHILPPYPNPTRTNPNSTAVQYKAVLFGQLMEDGKQRWEVPDPLLNPQLGRPTPGRYTEIPILKAPQQELPPAARPTDGGPEWQTGWQNTDHVFCHLLAAPHH